MTSTLLDHPPRTSDRVTSPAAYLRIDLDIADEATPNTYTLPIP